MTEVLDCGATFLDSERIKSPFLNHHGAKWIFGEKKESLTLPLEKNVWKSPLCQVDTGP